MSETERIVTRINENIGILQLKCETETGPHASVCTCPETHAICEDVGLLELRLTECSRDEARVLNGEITRLNARLAGSRDGRKATEKECAALKVKFDEVFQQRETLFRHNFEEVQRREKLETEVRELNANLAAVAEIMEPDKEYLQDTLDTWVKRARDAEKEVMQLAGANTTLRAQLEGSRECQRIAENRLKSLTNTPKNWGV